MSKRHAGVSGEGCQGDGQAVRPALALRAATAVTAARAVAGPAEAMPATQAAKEATALAEQLKAPQRVALEMLLKGETISATANLVGVNRDTIYHWLQKDAHFRAAYNQWSNHMNQSCAARLVNITDVATDAMVKAMQAGDGKLAFAFLKARGLLPPVSPLPTDPDEIAQRMDIEERRRLRRLKLDGFQFAAPDTKPVD